MTLIHIITICTCVYVHTRVVFYGAGTRDNLHQSHTSHAVCPLAAFACNSVAIQVKHLIIHTYTYTPVYIVQIAVIQSGFNNSELYKHYNYILNYDEIVFDIVYVTLSLCIDIAKRHCRFIPFIFLSVFLFSDFSLLLNICAYCFFK